MSQRQRVVDLYKTLYHLGREYPKGQDYFHTRLKKAFLKNRDITDPEKIESLIAHGNYIVKELEALYMLRKYRTLKGDITLTYELLLREHNVNVFQCAYKNYTTLYEFKTRHLTSNFW